MLPQPLRNRLDALDAHLNAQAVELRWMNVTNAELTASNDQMTRLVWGILQGTDKLPGAAGASAVDSVPRAIFNSHAVEMQRAMAILRQDIVGGGYNISSTGTST